MRLVSALYSLASVDICRQHYGSTCLKFFSSEGTI